MQKMLKQICIRYASIQGSHALSKTLFHTFQYLFNTKGKIYNTMAYLHFSNILFMRRNAKQHLQNCHQR